MKVSVLKLVTGEDVLGDAVECTDEYITLENPVGLSIVRGHDGQPNIGFSPFPLHAEPKTGNKFQFKTQHIIYSYLPAEDFVKNYEQIFGTGLITPPEKKIILG